MNSPAPIHSAPPTTTMLAIRQTCHEASANPTCADLQWTNRFVHSGLFLLTKIQKKFEDKISSGNTGVMKDPEMILCEYHAF